MSLITNILLLQIIFNAFKNVAKKLHDHQHEDMKGIIIYGLCTISSSALEWQVVHWSTNNLLLYQKATKTICKEAEKICNLQQLMYSIFDIDSSQNNIELATFNMIFSIKLIVQKLIVIKMSLWSKLICIGK